MILVGQYDSPFVRRVAITLNLYGMKFERNAISVFGDAKKMAQINPVVRIPSLILESGEVMIDSGAIIDYLDELVGPQKALMPRSGDERRRVLQIVTMAAGAIEKTVLAIGGGPHPETLRLQVVGQEDLDRFFVFDDQDGCGHQRSFMESKAVVLVVSFFGRSSRIGWPDTR